MLSSLVLGSIKLLGRIRHKKNEISLKLQLRVMISSFILSTSYTATSVPVIHISDCPLHRRLNIF